MGTEEKEVKNVIAVKVQGESGAEESNQTEGKEPGREE